MPVTEPNDAPLVYVRRHGPEGGYVGRYPEARQARDAERIAAWTASGRAVWQYYNNDIGGAAFADASDLMRRLGIAAPGPPPGVAPVAPGRARWRTRGAAQEHADFSSPPSPRAS